MQKQTDVHVTLSSAHIHVAVPAVAHVHARVVVVHREIAVVIVVVFRTVNQTEYISGI